MYLYTVIFENVKMVSQAYSTVQFSPYAFESLNKIILRLHCAQVFVYWNWKPVHQVRCKVEVDVQ